MEFKSQICTTKEQSERLLALGLKSVTADMHFYHHTEIDNTKTWEPSVIPYGNIIHAAYMYDESYIKDYITPAWSLHRLLEISGQRAISPFSLLENLYDDVIAHIKSLIHLGYIKKEYLDMDIVNANEAENMELLNNNGK